MTTPRKNTNDPLVPARCKDIRAKLPDFAAKRLGPMATADVQEHLLSCDDCSDAFGDALMAQIDSDDVELLTPPIMPSVTLYESYVSSRGVLWTWVREGLQAADDEVKKWAESTRDTLADFLGGLTDPVPLGPPRTRGGLRPAGAAVQGGGGDTHANTDFVAKVLDAQETTTDTVAFDVIRPPRVTEDGRFQLDLLTDAEHYDGRRLRCNVGGVSFEGTIRRRPRASLREVHIDVADVPGGSRVIPLDTIELAIVGA